MSIKPTINKKRTFLKPPLLTPVLEAPLSDAYCLPALKSAVLWQCGFADLYQNNMLKAVPYFVHTNDYNILKACSFNER